MIKRRKPIARFGIKPRAERKKRAKSSLSAFKKKLWKKFSAFIKQRDGNTCFVCGKTPLVGNDWHAAHCFSAGKYPALRWRFDNVFSGCAKCNIWLKGNYIEYHDQYRKRFGEEAYKYLHDHRNDVKQWRLPDLMEIDTMIDMMSGGPGPEKIDGNSEVLVV